MKVFFVTLHPEFVKSYFEFGIFKRAIASNLISPEVISLRDFAVDQHGTVDGRPYGGGAGMLLRPEPLAAAVNKIKSKHPDAKVFLLDPKGDTWNQKRAHQQSLDSSPKIFICGRFEGIDQRFTDLYVDSSISVGSYVLSGGELAAMSVVDSMVRLLGDLVETDKETFGEAYEDSHEPPQYTRPRSFEGENVPEELLSGDPKKISEWELKHKK